MTTTRYRHSVEPVYTDGRDIDVDVAYLTGEAAGQKSSGSTDKHLEDETQVWHKLPEPAPVDPTYYDRPLLNAPVWQWAIPTYYYVGGLAGASLALGAAAQAVRGETAELFIQRCHWIGFLGTSLSGVLLVEDLGVPSRFFNMLRVFRPTSPMNMGAWILTGTGGFAAATLVLRMRGRGFWRRLGDFCGYAAGVLGTALATYTGVLVANTAVPVWQQSRRVLPVLFGASAIASAGCCFELLPGEPQDRRLTAPFRLVGQVAEIAASLAMEHQASIVPRVGRPLRRGWSGFLWKASSVLTAVSIAVSVLPPASKAKRLSAGILGTAGSLLMRFAVEHAGTVSARDARASFHQQRAGHGAAEVTAPKRAIS